MTPITPSDTELLRLMMAKDEQAFAALYQRHHAPVYRFALLMSGRANIAEEVTQEVFLLLIREPQRYDETRGSLPAYLYGVARCHVLRFLRRERPYIPLVPESNEGSVGPGFIAKDDPFGDCRRNEVIRLVRQAVLALPERYREVVVLCDFQELSGADAAAALGCPIGTVNSRLHRGHALLIKKLRAAGKIESTSLDTQVMRSFA
jgi:RNA polymerase sigma-70 factor (ECF subfamily)